MLIECTIKRPGGSTIELFGREYRFVPRADGSHVCEIEDDKAVERLVMEIPEGYRFAEAEGPALAAPAPGGRSSFLPAERQGDKLIPKLEDLTSEELRARGRDLGLQFGPRMKDETMRKNLLLRYQEMMEPADEEGAEEKSEVPEPTEE